MTRFKSATRSLGLALLLALGVGGCDSFLDVNEDPNSPETVRMSLMLPGMLINFGHEIIGPTDIRYGNMVGPTGWGTEWLQHWAQNGRHTYAQHQWYDVANLDSNGFWSSGFADVMQECVNIMDRAEQTEDWAYHGIAKFMFAWTAMHLTDGFGPIPFSEAFDPTNANPKYDTQQEVYTRIFQLFDEAIEEMQRPSPAPGVGDLVYGGDMAMWVKLANSVKARAHMRLARAPGENTNQRAQAAMAALQAGIRSPADAPTIEYAGGSGNRQPWYKFEDQEPGEPSRSAHFFIEMLRANNDPRLPIVAEPAPLECPAELGYSRNDCVVATTTIYRGHPSGADEAEPDSAISRIGAFFSADSMPHVWFTYEDTKFLEAEAQLILGGAAAADAAYRAAIRANMERLGVSQGNITTYLNAQPNLGSVPNALEELITEKFVSNFLQAEAWHDWRRTGYPFVPLVNPQERYLDAIPQRLRTTAYELQFNSEQLAAAGIGTSLEFTLEKVWWAGGS